MKWAVLTHPAAGHIRPLLPVMAGLAAGGAAVECFATAPFRPWIEDCGAAFHDYGDHAWFERGLGRGGLCGGMDALLETSQQMLPRLAERVRALRPDALAYEAHALWAKLLAPQLGLPTVALCAMFAVNERAVPTRRLLGHLYGAGPAEAARDGLRALQRYTARARALERASAVRCPDILGYLAVDEALNLVLTARELQPEAPAFGPAYDFTGADDEAGPESVCWRPRPGCRRVLVALGTMYNDAPRFYADCFTALRDLPVDVILSVGRRIRFADLPPAPANFQVAPEVPQRALLRHTDLFVTHGGINSAHEAMLAGVPMLVLPSQADHHIVASQVVAVGAGIALPRAAAGAGRLREAVREALARPELQARSARMGDRLRAAGGARRAAGRMLDFAARSNRRTPLCPTPS